VRRAASSAYSGPDSAVIEAFVAANCGFSSDRIIADPDLNAGFVDHCRRLGLAGDAAVWNRTLMRLRKAGKLAHLAISRRTGFSSEELDQYLFASEIAMRRMLEEGGLSLDDVLCDPAEAQRFDAVASSFAPGFPSLQYRWAALTIRKRAHKWRAFSHQLSSDLVRRRFPAFRPIGEVDLARLKGTPGVYLVRGHSDRDLYAGQTFDLGQRVRRTLDTLQEWQKVSDDIQVGIIKLEGVNLARRCGFQSRLIRERTPDMNWQELGVA
jgi:site-specific DNA-methyltransferase (adenine-specific)